jgi:hypothetical protein
LTRILLPLQRGVASTCTGEQRMVASEVLCVCEGAGVINKVFSWHMWQSVCSQLARTLKTTLLI